MLLVEQIKVCFYFEDVTFGETLSQIGFHIEFRSRFDYCLFSTHLDSIYVINFNNDFFYLFDNFTAI
jgi:hypothetical protein